MKKKNNKSRKYYRKCGECGSRHEQSEMIRTDLSDNGWLCQTDLSDNGWLCQDCYYEATFYDEPHLEDSAFGYEW